MSDLPRIGREPNPAERTLANARENREAAEYYARNIYEYDTGGDWALLPDLVREEWIAKAIQGLEDHVRATNEPPPTDDPPDGGEPLPVEEVA